MAAANKEKANRLKRITSNPAVTQDLVLMFRDDLDEARALYEDSECSEYNRAMVNVYKMLIERFS